jgi:hypothetical protein
METEEKVNKTLEFIHRDRVRADDPYFSARLMARVEHEFAARSVRTGFSPIFLKLRPVFATATILLGIFAGILLGTRFGKDSASSPGADRNSRMQQFAQEEFITEINGSVEKQLLSKK